MEKHISCVRRMKNEAVLPKRNFYFVYMLSFDAEVLYHNTVGRSAQGEKKQ